MTKSEKYTIKQDDMLADFTNQILTGKTSAAHSSHPEEELRGLEETVLRLHRAYPQQTMDGKTTKRMLFDFEIRKQKINTSSHPVFWWSQQTLQRSVLVLAVVAILVSVFLIIPFFALGNGGIQASAGLHPQGIGLLVLLIGGILLVVWLVKSRK